MKIGRHKHFLSFSKGYEILVYQSALDATLSHTEAEEDGLLIKNLCQHIEQEKKKWVW